MESLATFLRTSQIVQTAEKKKDKTVNVVTAARWQY
jgi:hypothetical protein